MTTIKKKGATDDSQAATDDTWDTTDTQVVTDNTQDLTEDTQPAVEKIQTEETQTARPKAAEPVETVRAEEAASKPQEPSAAAIRAQKAADQAKAAARDAWQAFGNLFSDPVGHLSPAYESLGDKRALGVGAVFGVIAAFGMALASGVLMGTLMHIMIGATGAPGLHIGVWLSSFIAYLFGIAAGAAAVYLLTPIFGGRAKLGSSVYVSGSTFLPLGLAMFLAAIISWILSNRLGVILVSLLIIVGLCFTVLILNAGLRHIGGLNERRASLCTPAVLAAAGATTILINWLLR